MSTSTQEHIAALTESARSHPLYAEVNNPAAVRAFMAHHVVCVWDFMSLVKSLQRDLIGWSLPWLPPRFAGAARLINEIVLDEESDEIGDRHISHFELYLEAMAEAGVDIAPMSRLIDALRRGDEVMAAAEHSGLPGAALRFLRASLEVLDMPLSARVGAFYYGREQLIPQMFTPLLAQLESRALPCASLRTYLSRHIESDGERHGPLSLQLLEQVCGEDADAWAQARGAAVFALEARIALWDAVHARLLAAHDVVEARPQRA
ncbi:DUF3050 domain-containing protein [Haliangium ochraceum]|uniref:Heme oxygenase-like protein n=1 Tax=Haliangium ochraceum (strain DSM 14365 / JCM 11303 / SMP-2) TaxID=502025 RepID=D0LZR7_HALO1|nr:DUF3050 domain-containing protein [Haliangium ochraceum]ACY18046.1 conserved hypothetical protein [Haliangium ochraceum DSM 14365]